MYGRELLNEFYLDRNIKYLNHGSFGATPKCVVEEGRRIVELMEREPVRFFTDKYPMMYSRSIEKLADFIKCDIDNLALIENATSGINTILRSFQHFIKPGDHIITTNHVYPAVLNSLEFFCERNGADLKIINIPFPLESKEQILEIIEDELTPKVALAVFDHITSSTGLIMPAKEMSQLAKEHGAITVIDGAHAPGMIQPEIEKTGCDFYLGNCHKWLFAEKGCAFLWANDYYRQRIHPLTISHNYGGSFIKEFEWVGTRNPSSWFSLPKAIDFYDEHGGKEIMKRNRELVLEAGKMIVADLDTKQNISEDMTGSILTLQLPQEIEGDQKKATELTREVYRRHNTELMFTPFDGKIFFRLSAQIYNELGDYEGISQIVNRIIAG